MPRRILFLLLIVIAGCRAAPQASVAGSGYVKLYFSKSGEVTMDGKAATIDEIGRAFPDLAKKNGVVLYTRDSTDMFEPHPIVNKVMDLAVQNRLPIRLCLKKDCSDVIGSDGKLLIEK